MILPARVVRTCLLALLAPPASAPAQNPSRITALRFWSLGDITRVAIETDGEAVFHAERIDSPDRIFIDLKGTRRQPGHRGMETIPVGDRLVKQIRVGVLQPGVTRVVLDLASPVDYSISQLANPDRLIVELRVAGPAAPAPPARSVTGSHTMPEPPAAEPAKPVVGAAVPAGMRPSKPTAALPPAPLPEPPSTAPASPGVPAPLSPAVFPSREASTAREPPPAREPLSGRDREKTAAGPGGAVPPSGRARDLATAARRDSAGDRSLIRALGLKLERVVIDPGHGGHDTGTIGPAGYEEKMLVLDVARRLGALISQRLGAEIVFTRSDDTFIPLEERTAIANDHKADLFLSIHANSSRARNVTGTEVYYLNFTTDADALDVAARENATSQTSIHELQSLVQKIALKEKVQESREFAGAIQKSLYTGLARGRGRDRGVKKAPFIVLIGAQMPSVLAEIAFLSNPRQEVLLKRPDYRQRIAEALYKGVAQYASALSHFQVAKEPSRPGLVTR